jgi:hypothetical protein
MASTPNPALNRLHRWRKRKSRYVSEHLVFIAVAIGALFCAADGIAADRDVTSELSLRGPPTIYGLVVPAFPQELVTAGNPLKVHMRLSVTKGGLRDRLWVTRDRTLELVNGVRVR